MARDTKSKRLAELRRRAAANPDAFRKAPAPEHARASRRERASDGAWRAAVASYSSKEAVKAFAIAMRLFHRDSRLSWTPEQAFRAANACGLAIPPRAAADVARTLAKQDRARQDGVKTAATKKRAEGDEVRKKVHAAADELSRKGKKPRELAGIIEIKLTLPRRTVDRHLAAWREARKET